MLQKVWQKAFQGQSVYKVGFIKRELTPAMRSFLEMLSPPPVERTVAAASPTLTPLSSVVVPVDITQESSAAFTGETLLGKSTDKTGGGASGSTGASGGARGNGSEKATQFGPIAASTVKSTAMPVLPPPPKIAIVPPYLGPPVGSQATTAAASASLGAGQSAGYPGMPMGMGIPGMPPGMQMPPGMPPGMSPGMPLSMYPYSMPFMMPPPPPFMQQPAKIPTTPAEFMQYQQQQYFQYQQYMYQMFMMQQSQQPFQLNQGAVPHTAAAGAPHNMMMPGQPGMPMPMPPQMHMPLPNAPQSAPMQGAPDPNSSQRAEDPSSFSAGASGASSASSSFNLDGPLLLKNVGTGGNKTSKRVRKFNQVDTSPSASRSLYNTEETDTAEPSAKDISAVTAAAGAASEAVGASLPFDENSRSISFLQEDSLFFLESGSFGAGGADSIPFIGADSNAGVGGSAAAVSTGTSSNINNHNNQTQQQKHAADARASPKGAPSQPSAVAPPAKSGMVRSPQPSPRKPALKSILSKPEKKKIKPTLITSASVVTSANSAFQSGKTVRAAPTLAPTTAPPPKQTPATASAATSAAASVAPAPAPISPAPASSVASSSAVEVIELDGRSLMMDPDGLSRLWRDADSEESGSLSMGLGMGMDMGMSMNIHPSMLGDISMLDASKFAFSNFPQVTNGGAAAKSEDGDQEKRRGKRKAQELEARPHNGTKATRTDPAAQDFSSPCNSRASRYSRHSRSSAAQPHLDDNMSLLGDFFNDGEIVGSPLSNGGSFSHLSNLVSLHGPASSSVPKSTSRSGGDRGAKQREKGKNSDIPAVYDAAEKKNKKEETAVPAPAARAATKPAESARLFQNIGAMSTSLGRNLTPRSSSVTAENERFSGNGSVGSGGGVFAGVAGRSGLAGFSSSERFSPNGSNASFASNGSVPKKAKSALFAEIMAKAHQHSSQN